MQSATYIKRYVVFTLQRQNTEKAVDISISPAREGSFAEPWQLVMTGSVSKGKHYLYIRTFLTADWFA